MATENTPQTAPPAAHGMPLLGGIAAALRWLEELVNLLSGPLLTVGLGIALVALLTDGALLATAPALLYVWAISQAVGVDAQLVAAWDRARMAAREQRYWALVGHIVLGLLLAYVAFIAAQVFAIEQSAHISESAALARLGMDATVWLIQRTALAVGLVCLSGWTRYHPPAKMHKSKEEERAELERELELEPLRQRVREQRATGVASLGRGIIAAARGEAPKPPTMPSRPPTGPGAPSEAPVRTRRNTGGVPAAPIRLAPVRTGDEIDRAAAARAVQAERRQMRLGHVMEMMREARANGKTLTVGQVESRLKRLDRSRISRSTIQSLMRLAEERLDREEAEGGQAAQ